MSWLKSFVGVLVFSIGTALTLAQSPSRTDTSGWKTYRNETMGFEARYPNTWHVRLSTGSMESVSFDTTPEVGKPNKSVQFFIQRQINPKGLSIDQWSADQLRKLKAMPPPTTETFIGGRPTIRMETVGTLGTRYAFFTSLNTTDILTITITQPSSHAQLEQVYETILSTVKFMN